MPHVPSTNPDRHDLALAAAGDAQAFERLYLRHEDAIRRMFVILVRDAMQAEDLTQETFVMAWRKLRQVTNPNAFGRWLRRVGRNVLHDRIRASRCDPMRQPSEVADAMELPSRESYSVEKMDLDRSIAALPERYRRAFVLFHVEGYSHKEISALLEIPVGTSKIHVHRATLMLRKALVA